MTNKRDVDKQHAKRYQGLYFSSKLNSQGATDSNLRDKKLRGDGQDGYFTKENKVFCYIFTG